MAGTNSGGGLSNPTAGDGAVAREGRWRSQDAKARLGERVRRVRGEGPQHVAVHGPDAVVVMAAEAFQRLNEGLTGAALVEVLTSSPIRDLDLEAGRGAMPVRDVALRPVGCSTPTFSRNFGEKGPSRKSSARSRSIGFM
jgi:prevent-host-death family protein